MSQNLSGTLRGSTNGWKSIDISFRRNLLHFEPSGYPEIYSASQSIRETPQTLSTKLITQIRIACLKRWFLGESQSDNFFIILQTCTFSNFLADLNFFDFSRKSFGAKFGGWWPNWTLNFPKRPKSAKNHDFFTCARLNAPHGTFCLLKVMKPIVYTSY